MLNSTKTIQRAKNEIQAVLKRYSLSWSEIAPDIDREIWQTLRPTARKVRKTLFEKNYPSLK